MYFSKQNNAFYDESLKENYGENWPDDAVNISDDLYIEIMKGQSAGKAISSDDKGLPILTDQAGDAIIPKITRRQARLKLLDLGLLEQVEKLVYSDGNKALAIEYETDKFERSSPFFTSTGASFGLNDEAIDNLFIEAAQL